MLIILLLNCDYKFLFYLYDRCRGGYMSVKIKKRLLRQIDYSIILSMLIITFFGIITIADATLADSGGSIKTFLSQIMWFIGALVLGAIIISIDYNTIGSYYKVLYVLSNIMLVLVLVVGSNRKGHKSWLGIGQMGIQPSEFAKVVIIIVVAKLLEDMDNVNKFKNFIKIAIYTLIPMVLIQLQPDSGSNIIFFCVVFGMIFVAGLDLRFILGGTGAITAFILAIWKFNILKQYQKDRIMVFFNPATDKQGSGYNAIMAKTAVGSGQFWGLGYFNKGLTDGKFVPEAQTDFIFSAFAEKWGFIGCFILLLLYFNIIIRSIGIAKRSKDKFGKYMVIGIVTMMIFHILQNMGMNIGITPITGIPLPFMSYGGSSLISNVISIALIINVGIRKQIIDF